MTALSLDRIVAVIGAGTMGAGIAQVAASAGHRVLLFDAKPGAAASAIAAIARQLTRQVDKAGLTARQHELIMARLAPAAALTELADCALVIEAIVEDLDVKRRVFAELETVVADEAILATNTSSIGVTAIANGLRRPGRFIGMHFFNPAPLMALVEVVSGLGSDAAVAATVFATATAWGKSPVHAKSTPGFIVNRVARPFYAEGLRILQEGGGDIATIDAVLREGGGFRMGPFELMDLIGHDVNFAVTQSVWRAFFHDPRFQPSLIQQELVEGGWLGRKSGRGFYDYTAGATKPAAQTAEPGPRPERVTVSADLAAHPLTDRLRAAGLAVTVTAESGQVMQVGRAWAALSDGRSATLRARQGECADLVVFDHCLDFATASRLAVAKAAQASDQALAEVCGLFQALGLAVSVLADSPGLVITRIIAMLANEAFETVQQGVASASAVDLAMIKGVNYPLGPLAWAERMGLARVLAVLENLQAMTGEDRYRPALSLRQKVAAG